MGLDLPKLGFSGLWLMAVVGIMTPSCSSKMNYGEIKTKTKAGVCVTSSESLNAASSAVSCVSSPGGECEQ